MTNRKLNTVIDKVVFRIFPLTVALGFILFPFYWTLVTAFKREGDIVKTPIKYLPDPATLDNFKIAWNNVGFSAYFRNSLLVAVIASFVIMAASLLVGYSLSRYNFKGKGIFMLVLLCTQFIPGAMLLIPLFIIFKNMGLINNFLSLVLVYATFQIPFNSIVMRGFISNIPIQLEEAAYVDGCGKLQAIRLVIMPVLLPGLVAVVAFAFIGCWNEFLFALMLFNKSKMFTIPVGLKFMTGQFDINYGALAAGSVIAIIPAILLFAYIQKYLVSGMTAGSVKG